MLTINKKVLLRLFVATLILTIGLFLLNYIQSDRITDAVRWQSEHAAQMGRNDKAILFMRQYLELRPGDHEAAVKLGEMILARGNTQHDLTSVLFLYDRVLREMPQRDDVRRKLVDVCLQLDRNSDAIIHATALLEHAPNDGETWEKLGSAQAALNKFDEARNSYAKAIECDPTRIDSYALLAELLVGQFHAIDEAREWIEKMVHANPAAGAAYLVRARFQRSQKKTDDCMRDLEQVLKIDPKNAAGLLMKAELLEDRGQIAEARSALATGIALYEKDLRFYRALSWLEQRTGNLPASVACLEQGIKLMPNATELLTPLGDLLVRQGDLERVRDIVRKLETVTGFADQAAYLRGRLLMEEGNWLEAVKILDGLRAEAVAKPGLAAQANFLIAICYERLGKRDAQAEALKRVLLIDSGHLDARRAIGDMRLAAGELDEAIKEYAVAVRTAFAPLSYRTTLGRLMIAHARISNNASEWNNVAEFIETLRGKYKNSVDPVLLAAEMHMARQQYDDAKKLLREEAGKKVNDARIWSVLAALAQEADGSLAALDIIDEAQALIGDQVEIRLARARVWMADWQPGRAERIHAIGNKIEDFTEADQQRLLGGLTEVCMSIGDREGAKQFLVQLAAHSPRDLPVRRSLYSLANRLGDQPLRNKMRAEMSALAGESVAAVAEALAAAETASASDPRFAAWHELSRQVVESSPNRSDGHLLAAKLAEHDADLTEASKQYTIAVELEPGDGAFVEAQLRFLLRHGDPNQVKTRVERLYYDPRLAGDSFLGMIESIGADLPEDRFDQLIKWVEPLAARSGVSLLWLAHIEQGRKKTTPALALAARATSVAPRLIDAWVARIMLKPENALETLKEAGTKMAGIVYFQLCAEALDLLRAAQPDWSPEFKAPTHQRAFAQACLNSLVLRGHVDQAVQILTKFSGDPSTQAEDAAWAKRNLAVLAAMRGDADERRKATQALTESNAEAQGTLDELRSRVGSLSMALRHVHGRERREMLANAIEVLKRVVADKDGNAKDWYQLAQMHRMAGDRNACREAIKEAMHRDQDNLFYVVSYVGDLLSENRLDEAQPYLAKLLAATSDQRATEAAARFFAMSDRPARALEAVERFTQAADAGTNDGTARVRQAAGILDQAARAAAAKNLSSAKTLTAAALDKYRLSLKAYPEAASPMSALLAFDGRASAALDLLSSMRTSLSAKMLTTAAVAVLRTGRASPQQFEQVKQWIDTALLENPGVSALRLNLAELHALRQEYAVAEPMYRDALRGEPDNVVALNNLAWILAPRQDATAEALQYVERAIDISGPTGELLDTRARIFIARGDYEHAVEDSNEAIEETPTSLRYFHLALAQFKQSKKNEAEHSFKEAKTRGLEPNMVHPNDVPEFKVMAAQMRE